MGIQYTEIKQRLEALFAGNPGTGFNDWSRAVEAAGITLGRLCKISGSGTGIAHSELETIVCGIFKYP